MGRVRPPAVAGRFYPGDPDRLAATVDRLLAAAEAPPAAESPGAGSPAAGPPQPDAGAPLPDLPPVPDLPPAAYLVPHAGYVYSGPVAALAYARIRRHADRITRVVLAGPAHFVPLAGCAVPAATAWATPLGELPVTIPAGLAGRVVVDDRPHGPEHALEVQAPFLQRALGRPVPIVPIAVGRSTAAQVADCLAAAVPDPAGTLVLCSTDLSHYLDRAAASARDARTAAAIGALAADRIGESDACGHYALRGLLTWAGDRSLRPARLGLATSADTAGDPHRVVGYAAFAFHPPPG